MTTVIRNSFLASVIAQPRTGLVADGNTYRRYKSTVRTSATIGGNQDSRMSQILYEVGRAVNTRGAALERPGVNALLIDAAYPTSGALAEDFVGLSKKFTNFSADFAYSSLAGIVERLARALAAQSAFGEVDSTDLRGGRALTINALGTYDGPVNSLTNTVFVPRLVNSVITGDVFSVLANAIAGEGSSVATDVIELDAVTRQPIIPRVDSDGISRAIVEALRILGANMIASDQGPLFALAFTRGLHRVLTVVGHTDEGGITRDLLRCGHFGPPFGGIHYGLEPYAGIPALASNNVYELAAYVDALTLTSAALVAHCDPGTVYDGRWFPTVYLGTANDDPQSRPGEHLVGTAAHADRNRAQLLAAAPLFWQAYIDGLGKLFAAEGSTLVATAFAGAVGNLLPFNPRHLRFASVAPWFWVEPTSLLPHDFLGSRAETEGSGSFGGRDSTRTRPAWEDIAVASTRDTAFSTYHAVVRNARSSWFFAHWLNHPQNGLGAITIRQLDPNGIIHPGPCDAHPQVRDRVEAGLPWTDYLWVRGQSPFCAPGELLNLTGTVGFQVKHVTFDPDDGIPTLEHVPTSLEFMDTAVTVNVGRPMGVSAGPSNAPGADVRRAKTRASRELAASTARARLYGRADVGEMPTLTSAPAIRARLHVPAPHVPSGDGRGGVDGANRSAHAAGTGAADAERNPDGEPRTAVPHHQASRYPQVPRPTGANPIGGGGGALPPPPPGPPGQDGDDDDHAPAQPVAPAMQPRNFGDAPPDGPAQQ